MMALIQVCSSPLERLKKFSFELMASISIESQLTVESLT